MHTKIEVEGYSEKSVKSDIVLLTIELSSEKETAAMAFEEEKQIKNTLLENLKTLNFKKEDIKTTGFQLQPIYKNSSQTEYEPTLKGYKVIENLKVEFPFDLSILNEVLVAINDLKGTIHFSCSFLASQKNIENTLYEEAIKNAREKAEYIATNTNLKIIGIEEIKEIDAFPMNPVMKISTYADMTITPEDTQIAKKLKVIFLAKK